MKKLFIAVAAWSLVSGFILPESIQAVTLTVTGEAADYELDESQAVGNVPGTALRCGATSATTPGGRNVIFIFALPALDTTNQILSARLNFNYASKSGSPSFNADLWGAGFYGSDTGITNVFLKAESDTNAANIKLQNDVITPASAPGSITSADFFSYLQTFYATNGGSGGAYVFLRINPDANPGNVIVGYNLNSADSSSKPTLTITATNTPSPTNFIHPGLLHSQAEIDRMRQMVAQNIEPWASGFIKLSNDVHSQPGYLIRWQPTTNFFVVSRNPDVNKDAVESDCSAAYQLALMWCVTSNSTCAQKAIQILDDWSSSLTNIGGSDAILAAGLDGAKFLNAAELLRYSNAGWSETGIAQFSAMMTNVFYPVISNFATFANGNWDGCCEKTMAGIGIFCERPDIFARATNYFLAGTGAGALTNYIYPNGQCQESGRDQTHTQLGLGQLAEVCEMAWHQGVDLYGAASNRLLAGYEYTAKFNLGYDVPYTPADFTGWSNGLWFSTTISTNYRGILRPIFEMVYNHYVNRRGLSAPFTSEIATNILSPEGAWLYADHPGFGTLTSSLSPCTNWASRIQAESCNGNNGVSTENCVEGGLDVTSISSNNYIRFASVNLTNINSFTARVANGSTNPAAINIVLNNSSTGAILGTCTVPVTGGWQNWVTVSCNLAPTNTTAANLFLVFDGAPAVSLLNINWFCLNQSPASPWGISAVTNYLTGTLTPVKISAQPSGTHWFGGESFGNNSPGNFPVGTNYVTWFSTNSNGHVTTVTQTVVVAGPPQITSAIAGQQFQVSWPPLYTGWSLQVQTNSLNSGLETNWTTVTGSAVTNEISIPVAMTNNNVFYRLIYP
ncbi:MAG TPA: carbohydrate-binding protein [Verrucomicrobiae bacterium]|nr:carbohydrate-binding protein [Verrucomicrobiae bacterium]